VVNSFSKFVNTLGLARIAVLGLTAVSLLGFFGLIGLRISAQPMAPLYADIGADDAGKVAAQLDAMKITYELRGDGTMIYVPENQVLRLRMTMAEKGIPSGGTVGYEIFDNADALGTTSFLQNINQLRALEGELSRTIRSLDGIENVRVHLVLPERELFSRDKREPSASIVLKLRNGALSGQQVKAIQYLVASAIEGMTPTHVSIVDEKGTLLASGMGDNTQSNFSSSVEEQRNAYEGRMRSQVEDIIKRVVGADKARVEVTAQMDYNRVT
jgi:flagellar M-ring protein FliF